MNWAPNFLIIGAQKSGTTSLYNYLIQHPKVLPAHKKEIHFFSRFDKYTQGISWYQKHFPKQRIGYITGEATPLYLFMPNVAARVHALFPSIKLIVLLRNPITRAFSHWRFCKRYFGETLSFYNALLAEEKRLAGEVEKMLSNEQYFSNDLKLYSYLARGRYFEQIKHWRGYFPKEQLLILKAEELYNNPQETMNTVFAFLNLSDYDVPNLEIHNKNDLYHEDIEPKVLEYLRKYFEIPNNLLYKYLREEFGLEFCWES